MSKRHREFPEILWKNIEKFQENSLTYEVWNDDMMLELIEAKDERIKTIHQEVMQILYYNKDFVYQYRTRDLVYSVQAKYSNRALGKCNK